MPKWLLFRTYEAKAAIRLERLKASVYLRLFRFSFPIKLMRMMRMSHWHCTTCILPVQSIPLSFSLCSCFPRGLPLLWLLLYSYVSSSEGRTGKGSQCVQCSIYWFIVRSRVQSVVYPHFFATLNTYLFYIRCIAFVVPSSMSENADVTLCTFSPFSSQPLF